MSKIGIASLLNTSMQTAITLMNFLSARDQKKLREKHGAIIEEYQRQSDLRFPSYNDAKKGKAKRDMLNFINDCNLVATGGAI